MLRAKRRGWGVEFKSGALDTVGAVQPTGGSGQDGGAKDGGVSSEG